MYGNSLIANVVGIIKAIINNGQYCCLRILLQPEINYFIMEFSPRNSSVRQESSDFDLPFGLTCRLLHMANNDGKCMHLTVVMVANENVKDLL